MRTTHSMIGLLFTFPALLPACASNSPFPPDIREKVTPTFDFQAWREASPSNPGGKSDSGTKVELGGRIVQVSRDSKGVLIVAEQLPIVKHPVYGPAESSDRKGEYEFALFKETVGAGNSPLPEVTSCVPKKH